MIEIPYLTTDQMREVDRAMIEDYPAQVSVSELRENFPRTERKDLTWYIKYIASVLVACLRRKNRINTRRLKKRDANQLHSSIWAACELK